MQIAVIWLYTGQIGGRKVKEGVFTIARSTFPALRATVYRDFNNYLHELGIYQYIDHRKSLNSFHYQGREVSFIPTDDEHKLRGRAHSFAWLNECNDMSFEVFNQIIMRTEHSVYLDANPSGSPWFKTEIEDKRLLERGDVYLDVSTYKDNPFLPAEMVKEIEGLKFVDRSLWIIYTRGEWQPLKGLIFPEFEIIPDMPASYKKEFYGLDFGFVDPSSFVRVLISDNNLYIDQLIYEPGLGNDELASRIRQENPRRVYCDSAEPRTIEELKRRGVNAVPAKKGKDSIRQGINFIRQHKIYITERSLGAIEEFKRYKWSEDPNGKLLEKPIANFDHSADSVRYAVNRALGSKMRLV